MFAHLSSRERLGYLLIGLPLLLGVGYAGNQHLKSRPQLVLTSEALPVDAPMDAQPGEPREVLTEVVVHVAGAVKQPGVQRLSPAERVQDAIHKAGGPTADADLEKVNLAAKVIDGSQLHIPRKQPKGSREKPRPLMGTVAEPYRGGEAAVSVYSVEPVSRKVPGAPKAEGATGPVSLNTSTQQQLETLPGVGPVTAAKIIEYRHAHGGFGSIEELMEVKGIGPKKLEKMRPFLKL